MKIAILTQPLGLNYGGIMQAWALQQVLKKMGHEPVTINRQSETRSLAYRGLRTVYHALSNAMGKSNGANIPDRILSTVTIHTRDFIRANIAMSPVIDTTNKLREHFVNEKYEAVIVGSDQTWRPAYSPNIYNFFLDFLPDLSIKKIAYASSFGVDHWEFSPEQTKKCRTLARDFDLITVREASGVNLCKKYLGVDSKNALDPTLLLAAEEYRKLIDRYENGAQISAGLYTYMLDKSPEKNSIVELISKSLDLPIFTHQAEASLKDWRGEPIERYIMPPLTSWLSGFDRANLIVTDSFHGMVFSIIFRKPFLVISNHKRGATRFHSLLKQLQLNDRIISIEDPIPQSINNSIDTKELNISISDGTTSALTDLKKFL